MKFRAMSSCRCGQTGQWQLTKPNLRHTGRLRRGKTMCMRAFHRKMANVWLSNGGSAGSLQWSGFRENPTKVFDLQCLAVEYVTEFSGRTDASEVRCDLTDRHTDTQTQLL